MRKTDIVEDLYEKAGIPKNDASKALEIIIAVIKETLKRGEPVKIAGFGNFIVRQKKERTGRNPTTGEEMTISARKIVTFRPSGIFKKEVASAIVSEEPETSVKGTQQEKS